MSVPFSSDRPLSLAILAMGGQGGGVLADWIVHLAGAQGWAAQSTSVPGVAQRTGATIYYIEMLPPKDGVRPVFSLMPTPGDVDVVMAAEFMEAGRAMLRGLVTPQRTTLIASHHRSYAVIEKIAPGDGASDSGAVVEAIDVAARRVIVFDMQTLAEETGSAISATMFGALAGSDALPFARAAFEEAIRAAGKGVGPSLRAFAAGYERAQAPAPAVPAPVVGKRFAPLPDSAGHPDLDRLLARIRALPQSAQAMAYAGASRLVDYQDAAYAGLYLDRVEALHGEDRAAGGAAKGFVFTKEAAKYLATALAYDDVIRVADLKTRASRFVRLRNEIGASADQIVYQTEYMHPRMEEMAGLLPARLGAWLERSPTLWRGLDRIVNRGRRVNTGTIRWFATLHLLGAARTWRPGSLRHGREMAHVTAWLDKARAALAADYDLGCEVLRCRRLIKGYSDTHARGTSKFDRVMAALPLVSSTPEPAAWMSRLRRAALLDEDGEALEGAVKTVESLRA